MLKIFYDIINRVRNININLIFLGFLLAFTLDRLINYFIHMPVFVIFAIIALPLLILQNNFSSINRKWLTLFYFVFITVTVINNIIYQFHPKNIADLLFILLFFTFYLLYSSNHANFSAKWLHILSIIFIILFSFTFFSINNIGPIFSKTNPDKYVGPPSGQNSKEKLAESNSNTIKSKTIGKTKKTLISEKFLKSLASPELDYLEYSRVYHNGFFRVPQVASYFFGFLAIFYFYFFWNRNKLLSLASILLLTFIVLYTGTRIFPITIILTTLLWFLIKPKRWLYLLATLLILTLMVVFRGKINYLTEDTFFHQYFTFFITAFDNLPRLSRIILWNSWFKEVADFGVLDLLVGKTYCASLQANLKNVFIAEWFHNDFFSIVYSYGIISLLLYIIFYLKIFLDNKILIKNNFFVFTMYFSMLIMAFLNGFYYYFPMFTLYIYFLIIRIEQSKNTQHENWNIRD